MLPPRGRAGVLVALVPALPAAVIAWVVAAAALLPGHALTGVHSYTGTGYDDGAYLGASVRLLHGSLPWLDYDLLHPAGAVWIGLPAAILGELTHASAGLAAARIVTVAAAGLNVMLAGAVVRSRGRLAVFVTAMLFALMPVSYAATQTLLLEPYLVLFSLLGLTLLTTGSGEIAIGRRLVLAGAMVGVAVSVKVWAVLVAVAVIMALLPRWRAIRDWGLGVLAGAVVLTLPLAILAPGRFVHDVVVVQLSRRDLDQGPGLRERLPVILGLESLPGQGAVAWAPWLVVAVVAVVVLGLVADWSRRQLTRLHVVTGVVAIATFAGMAHPRQFFDHYAYFVVAMLVLPVGLAVAAIVEALAALLRRDDPSSGRSRWPALVAGGVLVLGGLWLVPGAVERSYDYTAESDDPGPLIRSYVPSGSCVATDLPTMLIVADRLPGSSSCGPLDPFGAWFTEDDLAPPGSPPPHRRGFVEDWTTWFANADYVVLSIRLSSFVPWTPELIAWFDAHYVLVGAAPRTYVYLHLPEA